MLVRLKREQTVFLTVDIQERLLPSIAGQQAVTENGVRLLKSAQILELPTLYTEQYPKGIGTTVPQILDAMPQQARRYEKTAFSCCDQPGFSEVLKGIGRSTVVVFGMETHICVLLTVAGLLSEGYTVVLAADACGSRDLRNHELALATARAWGAAVLPTETIVYHLLGVAGTAEFKALLPLFK